VKYYVYLIRVRRRDAEQWRLGVTTDYDGVLAGTRPGTIPAIWMAKGYTNKEDAKAQVLMLESRVGPTPIGITRIR
jgi:hypothetical protein